MRLLKRFFTSASRKYPSRPLLGVSVVIFKPNFESVVLVERGQEPKKGEWSFPGGLVNVGETIEEAAKREVFEEIGITDVNIITPYRNRFEGVTAPTFVNTEHIYLDEEGKCQYHYLLAQILATTNVDGRMLLARDDVNNSQFFPCVEVVNRTVPNTVLVDKVPDILAMALQHIDLSR